MDRTAEKTLTLTDLWRIFRQCFILMVLAAVLVGGLAALIKKSIYREEYTSTATIFILRNQEVGTEKVEMSAGSEASYAMIIIDNCIGLMKLDPVYQMVIDDLGLSETYTINKLRSCISISADSDTSLITVKATADNPELAQRILLSYTRSAETAVESPAGFNNTSLVNIPQTASLPTNPSNAPYSLTTLVLVAFLAAVAVYLFFLIRDLFNDQINTAEDLAQISDLTVLGSIPNATSVGKRYSKYGKYGQNGKTYGTYGAYNASGTAENKGTDKEEK